MKVICDIYRSRKREGMYLYLPHGAALDALPEALLKQFGPAELAMTVPLTPQRKLARAPIERVLAGLDEPGYYLQMPPGADDYMQVVNHHNDRLV